MRTLFTLRRIRFRCMIHYLISSCIKDLRRNILFALEVVDVKRNIKIALLLFTAILAPILVGVGVWEITNQPLIDYKLDSNNSLNLHYKSNLPVKMMIRNRGGIDASVWLVLTVENATIQEPQGSSILYNETQTKVGLFLTKGDEDWGIGKTLKVIPKEGTQTFSVHYSVTKNFDLLSVAYRLKPIYPITLIFNQTQPETYTLVE